MNFLLIHIFIYILVRVCGKVRLVYGSFIHGAYENKRMKERKFSGRFVDMIIKVRPIHDAIRTQRIGENLQTADSTLMFM